MRPPRRNQILCRHGLANGKTQQVHLGISGRYVGKAYVLFTSFLSPTLSNLLKTRPANHHTQQLFSSFAPIPLFVIHVLLAAQSVKDALTLLRMPRKQDVFDEEMVRITKSVEVATLGSQNSPRLQGEKEGERERV